MKNSLSEQAFESWTVVNQKTFETIEEKISQYRRQLPWLALLRTISVYMDRLAGYPSAKHDIIHGENVTPEDVKDFSNKIFRYRSEWIKLTDRGIIKLIKDGKEYDISAFKSAFGTVLYGSDSVIGRFLFNTDKRFRSCVRDYLTEQNQHERLRIDTLHHLLTGIGKNGISSPLLGETWSVVLGQPGYWKEFGLVVSPRKNPVIIPDFEALLMGGMSVRSFRGLLVAMSFITVTSTSSGYEYKVSAKNRLYAIISVLTTFRLLETGNKKNFFLSLCKFLNIKQTRLEPPKRHIMDDLELEVRRYLEAKGFEKNKLPPA